QAGGVLRKAGAGKWVQTAGASGPMRGLQATRSASFAWTPGSPSVYLYDRASGVWRSSDDGLTWTRIWSHTSNVENTGYVAADPRTPSVLYVSSADALYRLDGADAGASVEGGTIVAAPQVDVPRPGPLAVTVVGGTPVVY